MLEQELRAALRKFQKHLTFFLRISDEIHALSAHLSATGWVDAKHAHAVKRIHKLLERKIRLHRRYRYGIRALSRAITSHLRQYPDERAANMLLNYLSELQPELDEAAALLGEENEDAHVEVQSQHLLEKMRQERELALKIQTLSETYAQAFKNTGAISPVLEGVHASVKRLHPFTNLAHAVAAAILVIGLSVSAYSDSDSQAKPPAVIQQETLVAFFQRPEVALHLQGKWVRQRVGTAHAYPVMRRSKDGQLVAIQTAQGVAWAQMKDVTLSASQAATCHGPDRVHHTSGHHIGGERPLSSIRQIIVHITDSEDQSAENSFHNHKQAKEESFSSHYIIERDGKVVEIVPLDRIAFHCKRQNPNSIGIEVVGKGDSVYTLQQLRKIVALIRHLQSAYRIGDAGIFPHFHYDKKGKTCPGPENWRMLQYELQFH